MVDPTVDPNSFQCCRLVFTKQIYLELSVKTSSERGSSLIDVRICNLFYIFSLLSSPVSHWSSHTSRTSFKVVCQKYLNVFWDYIILTAEHINMNVLFDHQLLGFWHITHLKPFTYGCILNLTHVSIFCIEHIATISGWTTFFNVTVDIYLKCALCISLKYAWLLSSVLELHFVCITTHRKGTRSTLFDQSISHLLALAMIF